MSNTITSMREARQMVADTQRSHAKDWLDEHGFKFSWKDEGGELVLVTPAAHNAGVFLRPDEFLSKDKMRDLRKYVRARTAEDAKLRRMRTLEVGV